MDAARAIEGGAGGAGFAALRAHAPPRAEFPSLTAGEVRAAFGDHPAELEQCERILAWAARARGALDVALAEGLHALRRGERLAALGCHLDDYAREVLDLGRRAALGLARLGEGLRTRPLLRAALRSGRVRLRAAQTVLAVARGEREALWVERAARLTVRSLEDAVRREARGAPDDEDEAEWLRLDVALEPDDRALVDAALDLAGEVSPGSGRVERLEVMAAEYLGELGGDPDHDERRRLWPAFRAAASGEAPLRAALEAETERWGALDQVVDWSAPEVRFDDAMSADEVDALLRELARLRAGWEDLVGVCAHMVKESRLHLVAGFASFRHYVEERLGLGARAVEQRAALERRLAESPALREARSRKLPFEKLRLLARLPEREILAWTERAGALTCVALARALDGERERQLRARRRLAEPVPRRVAVLLAAALAAVEERCDRPVPAGKALAILAWHFFETYKHLAKPRTTRSRKVRQRDHGRCQVPGCSRRAHHAHHVTPRSHGGGDEEENLVGLCAFHHLRCVHGGWLRVVGRAPDGLTWILRGKVWTGPRP